MLQERGGVTMNQKERHELLRAIVENDDYYKKNPEAQKRLEQSLKEVELIQKGELPRKTARELLEELRKEERKKKVEASYKKLVEQNGEALRRLAKE